MRRTFDPCIIDIEASGFGSTSYPVEVGVALEQGRKFCTLIAPAPNWTHWDIQAEGIHKLTRDKLEQFGKPVDEVADQLNQMLSGITLYSDGWVVDKPWMTTLFSVAGRSMNFNISPLEMILNEQQMSIWHETRDQVTKELNMTRHRASNDARIIQETYNRTLRIDL